MKGIAVVTAVIAAVFGAAAIVDAKPKPKQKPVTLQITSRLGNETTLGPYQDGETRVQCPYGYVAVGGGVYQGAIELAYDGPTDSGKGWEAGGINPSTVDNYGFEAIVNCAKGTNRNLRLRVAMTDSEKREALRELRSRLH
jgi:hypothetical protein